MGRLAWPALAAVLLVASFGLYSWYVGHNAGQWVHSDEYIYRAAGITASDDPGALYHLTFGLPGFARLPFAYPPFAAWLLGLFGSFSWQAWQAWLLGINLALLPVICYLAMGMAGHRGRDRLAGAAALAALSVWLEPVFQTMFYGQINLILLALLIWDLSLPDTSRWKGIGVGIAAAIKLTPLIFCAYLLVSRRIRAGLVSLATFAATIAIGFALLPAASRQYWGGRFLQPGDNPALHQNQSLYGVLARVMGSQADVHPVWLAAAAVVGVAGLATAAVASRRGQELLGVVTAAITGLLVSEISWEHHWVWVIVGLALITSIRPVWWRVAGFITITVVFFMWPAVGSVRSVLPSWLRWTLPGFGQSTGGFEISWLVYGVFVIAGLIALATTAGYLWFSRDRPRQQPDLADERVLATEPPSA
jgi:alpha-1,2-mannosyltransferase